MKLRLYEDNSRLSGFLKCYEQGLKQSQNKLVKQRSADGPDQDFFTILNPRLSLDDNRELSPTEQIPLVEVTEYYRTLFGKGTWTAGLYVKVSRYVQPNYRNYGSDLVLSVVNRIAGFLESHRNVSKFDKLDFGIISGEATTTETVRLGNVDYHVLRTSSESGKAKHRLCLYSDSPWESRRQRYMWRGVPFYSIPFILNRDTMISRAIRAKSTSEANTTEDNDSISSSEFMDSTMAGGVRVLPSGLEWPEDADRIVNRYLDTSLLRFLRTRELPRWAVLLRHAQHRSLSDSELDELNEDYYLLHSNPLRYLNAATVVAAEYIAAYLVEFSEQLLLSRCLYCHRMIPYRKSQKYCSLRANNRDCGTKARNRRYYNDHADEIRARVAQEQRLYRELLKKLSVKK